MNKTQIWSWNFLTPSNKEYHLKFVLIEFYICEEIINTFMPDNLSGKLSSFGKFGDRSPDPKSFDPSH